MDSTGFSPNTILLVRKELEEGKEERYVSVRRERDFLINGPPFTLLSPSDLDW